LFYSLTKTHSRGTKTLQNYTRVTDTTEQKSESKKPTDDSRKTLQYTLAELNTIPKTPEFNPNKE
jgi:hypothetical protein